MGQKVSPIGLRIGINKDWQAKWYAPKNEVGTLLNKDIKIRKFLSRRLKDAAVSDVIIERRKNNTEISLHTAKPGIVIGRGGEEIEKLKKELSKLVDENVKISIIEIKKPDMVAQLVADNIARQIEGRVSFRVAQKRAIRNTMKAGAKGIKTLVSGRLGGAEMARSEGYTEGMIPLHTLRSNIDYALSEAHTTFGLIGVKVWIYKGEILPNKQKKGGNNNVDAKKNEI
ncbi:MAG: 30S ribosomal protein S3 [Bacilli bacterium]|nr:30S ribosomal protein S3 [Bacilli bacterium]MDD3304794.1 30S ribosomal protein S3 [Bacilli bacterium]MDD4053380.1 30S ribosomal protein S3 [Bacilli bacterium]MDD4410973.1 30S ribosomal protein S3 [Bacilli bacterium]